MTFIVFLFQVYTRIVFFFTQLYKDYFEEEKRESFFIVNSVVCNNENITDYYIYKNTFDFKKYTQSLIDWKVNGKMYTFYLTEKSAEYFPPYSFHSLKSCLPENRIVTALIVDNSDKSIENVSKLIKQIAGPKQNFYKDLDYSIKCSDIWDFCDKTLTITTTTQTKQFDLSKDNILEL